MFERSLLDLVSKLFFFFFDDHFLSLLKRKLISLDDHSGCTLLKMTITWIDYFFGQSFAIKIISLATI